MLTAPGGEAGSRAYWAGATGDRDEDSGGWERARPHGQAYEVSTREVNIHKVLHTFM